jgi:3-hydroxyacyl-CoA dehydrogenase
MTAVRYKFEAGIAWLTMNNPPLNALSHALRLGIVASLDKALADKRVRAIVLCGNERAFSSGADIKEFSAGTFYAEPFLPAVVDALEASHKPVIAAISGACMGGGLEVALGCHYRVALVDSKIAFPEVKLGLIPGAGGTQRFPRLVGLETAINLIVSGATMPAAAFKGSGLFDVLAKDNLAATAREFALTAMDKPVRRVRDVCRLKPSGSSPRAAWPRCRADSSPRCARSMPWAPRSRSRSKPASPPSRRYSAS